VPASTQTPRTCRRPVVQPKGFFAELFIQEKMKHDENMMKTMEKKNIKLMIDEY